MTMEQFHHKLDDGREVVLPPFTQIPFGVVRKLRKEDDAEQLFALMEQVAAPEMLEIIDTLTLGDIERLFTDWQKDAKVTVGESSASTGS